MFNLQRSLRLDKFLVVSYIVLALAMGISSGWLGSFIALGIICAALYVYERRRLPISALLLALPIIFFFQPAKQAFRSRYWRTNSAGHVERASYWVNNSWHMWARALDDESGASARLMMDGALSRFALLQQTANVLEVTPRTVPYQYGRLYSYLAVTLIPRFIWPDKPSVNDANRWYQVSYGITPPNMLSGVSIAVGALTESYINFGWLGPPLIIFALGVVLQTVERILLRYSSGLLLSSLGAVLLPGFIAVEAQLAQYLAGVLQQVVVALLVLLPILKFHRVQVPRRIVVRVISSPRNQVSPPQARLGN